MQIPENIQSLHPQMTAWRHDLHRHPELDFDVHRTASMVATQLRAAGVDEVVEGVGRTGVVGIVRGERVDSGKTIGLRADMDALPINEITGLAHASTIDGRMHACGHDGHTTMLLGAATELAATRQFNGTVAVIFQPAEEGGGGGRVMVEEGMMERFAIDEVYGMHNLPGLPVGEFAICPGPIMAAVDSFEILLTGRGGHAAMPHQCIDTPLVAAQLVIAMQSIASRRIDPLQSVVLSITSMRSDSDTFNVIPEQITLRGTVRALDAGVRAQVQEELPLLIQRVAESFGARAELDYDIGYPATVNTEAETEHAAEAAAAVSLIRRNTPPLMAGEDFSYMLDARRGAFIFIGNGDSASLHHPNYDFNDSALPIGSAYWLALIQQRLG